MFLSRTRVWMLLVLITLVGAFFRFYQLGHESVWDGEIFTLLFSQFDWSIFLQSVSTFSAHPPLWFALTKVVIAGGWNETLLRYPAAFAGVLSVPALYVLSKRMVNTPVGLIAAALMAFSPLDVIFSQNARNYAFFVLLTIFLLYSAVRATEAKPGAARWWILFVAAGVAGLYTHYLFVLPLAGTVLAIAVKLVWDAMRQARTGQTEGSASRSWWRIALVSARWFLVALIAVVALYLPWTPSVGSAFLDRQLRRESANEEEEAALTLGDAPRLLKDFGGDSSWGLVLVAALAVVGVVMAWRDHKRAPLFWFGLAILLPILVTVLLAPRRLPAKYLIYVLPAYLLFVACGIAGISEFVRARFLRSDRFAYAPALVLVGLVALAAVPNMPYWNGTRTIFTGKGWLVVDEWKEWRETGNSVVARAPGDFVLFPSEARALTARSIVPYFDAAFLQKLYSAPPTTTAWWVSETADVPPANAPLVKDNQEFRNLVVQKLEHPGTFQELALPNASFENGFEGWNRSGDALDWTTDAAAARDGQNAAKLTLKRPEITTLISDPFDATSGKFYRVTALVKNPTVGFYTVSPQLFVNFSDATGRAPRRTRLATVVPTEDPEWFLMVADGIVPEDTTTARVEFAFREYATALGPTSWVDDVKVWMEE